MKRKAWLAPVYRSNLVGSWLSSKFFASLDLLLLSSARNDASSPRGTGFSASKSFVATTAPGSSVASTAAWSGDTFPMSRIPLRFPASGKRDSWAFIVVPLHLLISLRLPYLYSPGGFKLSIHGRQFWIFRTNISNLLEAILTIATLMWLLVFSPFLLVKSPFKCTCMINFYCEHVTELPQIRLNVF